MTILNLISLIGIFALCGVAWLFSENRSPKFFPWRTVALGILLQLALGALVFAVPITREILNVFSQLLDGLFLAADTGANFIFGRNIVPLPDRPADVNLGYIFAFRALPTVVFFSGLMALLYSIGVIQVITNFFAKIFYSVMRLSGAEALSGAANIFVGIEAAIVVRPFLSKMTRSELCAILACCFGTAASSTLAIYVSFLRPVFPNILGHLVSASIIAIPACFVLSKILVPETEVPLTAGRLPKDLDRAMAVDVPPDDETVAGEPLRRMSPMDAAIVGALDGVKMAVAIAAVLIVILGLVSLINQIFGGLAALQNLSAANSPGWVQPLLPLLQGIGQFFSVVTLANILGALFLPLTALTGVSLEWNEIWQSSVIIGRRLLETAIPPYQALAAASEQGILGDRALLIVSYALSGFAHLASVGIFVGGTSALIPSRRREIADLGWKALFIGTLATYMIACVAGVFDTGSPSILGDPSQTPAPATSPAPSPIPSPGATIAPSPLPSAPTLAPTPPAPAPSPEALPPPETLPPTDTPPVEVPPVEPTL